MSEYRNISVLDRVVGKRTYQYIDTQMRIIRILSYMLAESACFNIFLQRHYKIMLLGQIRYHLFIYRLGKARVDERYVFAVFIF